MSRTINQSKMFDYLGIGTVDLRHTPDLITDINESEKFVTWPKIPINSNYENYHDKNYENYHNDKKYGNLFKLISILIGYMYNVILLQFLVILLLCGVIGFSYLKTR